MQKKCKHFFARLYYHSETCSVLEDILADFKIEAIDPLDIIGRGIPTTGNTQYPIIRSNAEEIIKHSKNTGALFVLGDTESCVSQFNILPGRIDLPPTLLFITFLDYKQKQQYAVSLGLKQAEQLCKAVASPIIVSYSFYPTMPQMLLHTFHSPVFCYCDRSYINAVQVIQRYTDTEKNCQIISYKNESLSFEVLLIEIESGIYFLLPMMELSVFLLSRDIQNGTLKLKKSLTVDDSLLSAVDTVINSIFYY